MQVDMNEKSSATVADDLLKSKMYILASAQSPNESKQLEESTPYSGVLSMDPTRSSQNLQSPTKVQTGGKVPTTHTLVLYLLYETDAFICGGKGKLVH